MVRLKFWGVFSALLMSGDVCLSAFNVFKESVNEFSQLMSQIVLQPSVLIAVVELQHIKAKGLSNAAELTVWLAGRDYFCEMFCFSGPSSVQMENDDKAIATVTGLQVGTYRFRLTVKDQQGLSSASVLSITVKEGKPGCCFLGHGGQLDSSFSH